MFRPYPFGIRRRRVRVLCRRTIGRRSLAGIHRVAPRILRRRRTCRQSRNRMATARRSVGARLCHRSGPGLPFACSIAQTRADGLLHRCGESEIATGHAADRHGVLRGVRPPRPAGGPSAAEARPLQNPALTRHRIRPTTREGITRHFRTRGNVCPIGARNTPCHKNETSRLL